MKNEISRRAHVQTIFNPYGVKPSAKHTKQAVMYYASALCSDQSRRVAHKEQHGNLKGYWPKCMAESWEIVKRMISTGKNSFVESLVNKNINLVFTGLADQRVFEFSFNDTTEQVLRMLKNLPNSGFKQAYIKNMNDFTLTFARDYVKQYTPAKKKTLSINRTVATQKTENQKITVKPKIDIDINRSLYSDSEMFVVDYLSRVFWDLNSIERVTNENMGMVYDLCDHVLSNNKNKSYIKSIEMKFIILMKSIKKNNIPLASNKLRDLKNQCKQYINYTIKSCATENDKQRNLLRAINKQNTNKAI